MCRTLVVKESAFLADRNIASTTKVLEDRGLVAWAPLFFLSIRQTEACLEIFFISILLGKGVDSVAFKTVHELMRHRAVVTEEALAIDTPRDCKGGSTFATGAESCSVLTLDVVAGENVWCEVSDAPGAENSLLVATRAHYFVWVLLFALETILTEGVKTMKDFRIIVNVIAYKTLGRELTAVAAESTAADRGRRGGGVGRI